MEILVFLLGFAALLKFIGPGKTFIALLLVALFVTTAVASVEDTLEYAESYGEVIGIDAETSVVTFPSRYQNGQSWVERNGRTKQVTGNFIEIADHVAMGKPEDMSNTVRHEYCHLWVVKTTGKIKQGGKFHGSAWKACAREHGVDFRNALMN